MMRIVQQGEYFIIQERLKFFWIPFWINVQLGYLWNLGVAYYVILFRTKESAVHVIDLIKQYPHQVKYKGFSLNSCWINQYRYESPPLYYHAIHSRKTAGGFTQYYPKSLDEFKKYIDDHLEKKKTDRIKKIVYKS